MRERWKNQESTSLGNFALRRLAPSSRESPTRTCVVRRHPRGRRRLPPPLGKALLKARRGLVVGRRKPELALDGTGGTYFLAGLDGVYAGCFKPSDEETFCENNPRLFAGDSSALRRVRDQEKPTRARSPPIY